MANEWRSATLGDISGDVSYGYTESASLDRVGPRFLRITDIQNGVVNWHTVPYCPITPGQHEKYRLRYGDIVVARTGNSTGENYLFDSTEDAVFASYLIRFRIDPREADARFVWYTLRSANWWTYVNASKTGSAQAGANAKVLGGYPISLPPLPEQRAIAHVLGTLDDKIECNRRLNRTLEGIVRALFKSWFIDFDPVIDNALAAGNPIPDELADRAALRQQAAEEHAKPLPDDLRALFPAEFTHTDTIGWIPKGWEVAPLSSIATNPRRTVQPADVAPETPYIGLEHMPRRSISLDAWGQAADVASGKSRFNQGEILFGKLRPYFHKVGLAPVSGVCSTDILVVVPKLDCWHTFVLALVSSKAYVDYTDQCSAGTKMPRTNWTDMGRYGVAMPPTSLAETFQQHTAKTLRRIAFAVCQNGRLSALRDTLLPKLLTGEVTVPVAATLTEEASR